MNQQSKNTSTILFVILTGLLLVIAFISYNKISQYNKSVEAVMHTNLVKSKVVEVLSNLKDATNEHRGFLLTNDTAFLRPFKEIAKSRISLFASLDSLISDNPQQQKYLKELKLLVDERYVLLNESLKLSKNSIPDPLINSALINGKNKMDEVRNQIEVMLHTEDEILLQRTKIKDRSASFTPIFLLLLSVSSIFIITLFFFRLQKETKLRVSTEKLVEVEADARKKIEISEAKFRQAISNLKLATDSANVGIWSLGIKTQKLEWSALHKRMWGYDEDRKDLEYENWHQLILPEDKERTFEKVEEARLNQSVYESDYYINRANDGALRYMRSYGKFYYNDKGKAETLTGITIDLTEQKEAQQRIDQSEVKFKTLAETIPIMIWTAKADGEKNFFNQYYLHYTGLTFDELKGGGMLQIIFPADLEKDLQQWNHSLKTGEDFKIEKRILCHDGTYRWHLSHGIAQKNNQGIVTGWIGSNTEIEEQKKFTAALETQVKERTVQLQRQNKMFELAESIAKFGSYIWNINTGALEYSDNLFRLLDCEPQEFVPSFESFLSFIHPHDLQQVISNGEQTTKTGVLIETPYRIITKAGKIKYLRSSGGFSGEGANRLLIGTVQDISKDVIAAKELSIKNLELENANTELASFSYVASHDLQEPLRKIQGFSKRIIDNDQKTLSDTAKNYFNRIIAASVRMQNLIESLLNFSRTNLSQTVFERTDLNKTLNEVQLVLNDLITQKNAVIESETLPTLNAVPFQMQQLFLNLIGNSLKYSKPDLAPHIKITAEKVLIHQINEGVKENEDFWKIVISDNGIGFEQQYEHKIFEVFQRLHGKTEYDGTGIGLAICKKIVQTHNGTITATGQLGLGSIFTFFLSDNNKS